MKISTFGTIPIPQTGFTENWTANPTKIITAGNRWILTRNGNSTWSQNLACNNFVQGLGKLTITNNNVAFSPRLYCFPAMDVSAMLGQNQFAQIQILAGRTSTPTPGICVLGSNQSSSGTDTGYFIAITPIAPNTFQLRYGVDGTILSDPWGGVGNTWADNDIVRLSCQPGAAQNVLTLSVNGVVRTTFTDSTATRLPVGQGVPCIAMTGAPNPSQFTFGPFSCGVGL